MFTHILVPTDGSPLSQEAVRKAVIFAKETGARITAFYAKPAAPMAQTIPISTPSTSVRYAAQHHFHHITGRRDACQLEHFNQAFWAMHTLCLAMDGDLLWHHCCLHIAFS